MGEALIRTPDGAFIYVAISPYRDQDAIALVMRAGYDLHNIRILEPRIGRCQEGMIATVPEWAGTKPFV